MAACLPWENVSCNQFDDLTEPHNSSCFCLSLRCFKGHWCRNCHKHLRTPPPGWLPHSWLLGPGPGSRSDRSLPWVTLMTLGIGEPKPWTWQVWLSLGSNAQRQQGSINSRAGSPCDFLWSSHVFSSLSPGIHPVQLRPLGVVSGGPKELWYKQFFMSQCRKELSEGQSDR